MSARSDTVNTGDLFPPSSNNSPVALDDCAGVKKYVTPMGAIEITSTYEPLSSVWEGSDGALLEEMFKFYATIPPEPRSGI